MRPSLTLYILSFISVAYCVRQHQQEQYELEKLRRTLEQSPGNINVNQLDVVENHPPPPASHPETKVSYVTSFWAKVKGEDANPHRREVEASLLANIHNPHFDQVVVFLDREDNAESCVDFHQVMSDLSRQVFSMTAEESNALLDKKVKCVDVQTGQPTYYQMFSNALSDVVTGDVVVLANADMAYDDTMSLARSLHPEVLAVLGTSGFTNKMTANVKKIYEEIMGTDYIANNVRPGVWEVDRCAETRRERIELEVYPNRGYSWDTWIFHKSKLVGLLNEENFKRRIKSQELVAFNMNEMGAENAALWAVQQAYSFSDIYYACDKIHSWHFHLTPKTHKARLTPWLLQTHPRDIRNPLFSPRGAVPKPWGGYPGETHPFARKDPDCVRADSCFMTQS